MRNQSAGKSVEYFGLPAASLTACVLSSNRSVARSTLLEFAAAHESENDVVAVPAPSNEMP